MSPDEKMSSDVLDAQQIIYSIRPHRNGYHFGDDSFICIFFKEDHCILIQGLLKEVNWQYVSIDSGDGLVPYRLQAITWSRGDTNPWRHIVSIALGHSELIDITLYKFQC